MSVEIRRIVVGVANDREPDHVLGPAIDLARRLGAELSVVHAFIMGEPLIEASVRLGYLSPEVVSNYGRKMHDEVVARVQEITSDASVQVRTVNGKPDDAILAVAAEEDADLILVGPTRHGRLTSAVLGSTCQAVLRRSRIPVLLLRETSPVSPSRVLISTDLSVLSAEAHDRGVALANALAERAPEYRSLLVIGESLILMQMEKSIVRRVAEDELRDFLGARAGDPAIVQSVIREGEPAVEIAKEVREWGADLVVLGTHARKRMERLLLGSVAEATVRTVPCNVLVVPAAATAGAQESAAGAASVGGVT
jgi:universal stress protein E